MIPPFLVWILAGVTFIEQEIPGVHVGGVDPLSGQPYVNFRQADLDGDGLVDLVLSREVLFQRNGAFGPEVRADLPDINVRPFCDLWHGALYLRLSERLKLVQWENSDWVTALDQEIPWAEPGEIYETPAHEAPEGRACVRFQRFLLDLEADGVPEIVLTARDGVHIYRRRSNGYTEAAILDVLPPLTVGEAYGVALWPPERRRIALPERHMMCWYCLAGATMNVLTREYLPDKRVRYHVTRYTIDLKNGYAINHNAAEVEVTEPMPVYAQACRLNGDGLIDYAGGDWERSDASALPAPIYETYVTLDGGSSRQTIRTRSFRPHCWFVDFDADGDLDMVTESTGLFDGGVRESVSRFLTGREIAHEVRIHFQDPRGNFSPSPDVRGRFAIRLDKAPCRNSAMFRRYLSAELFNITGDFNGDGYRDMVVQDRARRLAVYLSVGRGFPRRPDTIIAIGQDCGFGVADIDGDGQSDIAISLPKAHGKEWREASRVFFAREEE